MDSALGTTNRPSIKYAPPVFEFQSQQVNKLSDYPVDCREYNAASIYLTVSGSSPSATITVLGSPTENGVYVLLPDVNATQTAVTANTVFDVNVGQAFLKVQISSISGTYNTSDGFTIVVIPYVSGGQTRLNITNTASQNIAQVLGLTVSATNPLPTEISDGTQVIGTGAIPVPIRNVGGTITKFAPAMTAATAISLAAAAATTRKEVFVQWNGTDNLYLGNTNGVTNTTLFFAILTPGQFYSSTMNADAVWGYSVAGGAAYTCFGYTAA